MSVEEMIKITEYFNNYTDGIYEELEDHLMPLYSILNDLNMKLDRLSEQIKRKEHIPDRNISVISQDLPFHE